jgi:alpha-galactosidase
VETIANDWGFDFLKIDFIYAPEAIEAVVHDPSYTRAQALHEGVRIIRDALGPDRFLLGCGAPLGPCIGLVDAMRIGTDTKHVWQELGILAKQNIAAPSLKPALLATIQRSFMHNRLWTNDPDCVVVREHDSRLTEAEVILQLTVFGLSAGQVLISDEMDQVGHQRIDWFKRVLPTYSKSATPLDGALRSEPEVYSLTAESPNTGVRHCTALINWGNRPVSRTYEIAQIARLADGAETYAVFDYWNERYLGLYESDDEITLQDIPPHGCAYLIIVPLPALTEGGVPSPVLLCSTLHITAGAMEIGDIKFEDRRITATVTIPGDRSGRLFFLLPRSAKPTGAIQATETQAGHLVEYDVEVSRRANISIRI